MALRQYGLVPTPFQTFTIFVATLESGRDEGRFKLILEL